MLSREALERAIDTLRRSPQQALIALDFDGTLAPIVADPAQSRLGPGAAQVLSALAAAGFQLALISGREAATLLRLSGLQDLPGLMVEGLYGAEQWRGGQLTTPDAPEAIARLRARLPAILAARSSASELWIEDKRLSLVIHGRAAADPVAALTSVRDPVTALAASLGLLVKPGRAVLEVRLPGFDKAGALRRLLAETRCEVVVFAGDDVGDLPAFAAVAEFVRAGGRGWSIAVDSADAGPVREQADIVVDGPADLVRLLTRLLTPRPKRSEPS